MNRIKIVLLLLTMVLSPACSDESVESSEETDGPPLRERDASGAQDIPADPSIDSALDAATDASDGLTGDGDGEDMAGEIADCGVVDGGLFISEIVDPDIDLPARARYIELYNAGNQAVSLAGWRLVRHFDPEGVIEVDLPAVTIAPCQAFVIARDSQGFLDIYGTSPDWVSTTEDIPGSVVDNNGDDAIALADASGVVDQFGIPGESGGDPAWSYDDSVITRNVSVIVPSATYQPLEWTVTPTPESTTGIATPGSR